MNNDERICSIALTLCPGIGHIGAKRLIDGIGSAAGVFSQRKELPELLPQATLHIVPNAGHELNKYAPNTIAEILNQ